MKIHYDLVITIFVIEITSILCNTKTENNNQEKHEKFNIRNRRAAKTTTTQKYYFYLPIEPVNRPDIAKSSEEVNFFHDSRARMKLLEFLQYNHSSIWNHSIEDAIYEPMKLVYVMGGIPKLNSVEGYFVTQRFLDTYEKHIDRWINNHLMQMVKEDKNYRRQNLMEMLRRLKKITGEVPYYYVEQYWAWEMYHTERYHKRETVLRNAMRVLYIQLDKIFHNYVFSQETFNHPGIPIIPFTKMMEFLQAGQPFMQDTLKKLFLGSIDTIQFNQVSNYTLGNTGNKLV